MVLQMRKGILDSERADVTFPTTLARVQTEMRSPTTSRSMAVRLCAALGQTMNCWIPSTATWILTSWAET